MHAKIAFAVASLCLISSMNVQAAARKEINPAEKELGERLFLEPRFAQLFFIQSKGDVNAVVAGDPVLATLQAPGSPFDGPFKGQTMSCRACHLEGEMNAVAGAGTRTYADFARRSPIPARDDGKTVTTRNSPALVGASVARSDFFLHFDGEFANGPDLVIGGFTGRNFGWLASERKTALKNIANVIRGDNGSGDLAKQFGGSYAKVFAADASVPDEFLLPKESRLDVTKASDNDIIAAVAKMVNVYLEFLEFSRDGTGAHNASPYDVFLIRNNLPRLPNAGESDLDYSRRLRAALGALTAPVFVTPADGTFTEHAQAFVFGADELAGLRIFLAEPGPNGPTGPNRGVGNCIACHAGPEFTDFSFHNTGATQLEYDKLHGPGAFAALKIPNLAERKRDAVNALPATAKHPNYKGKFRAVPSADKPGETDLGMWNVYANPDFPTPQRSLDRTAKATFGKLKSSDMLDKTIATFKTPGLRDLGHSQPYLHDGSLDTIRDVMDFYGRIGNMARAGQIRNPDAKLAGIDFTPEQAVLLTKFLMALNEDFED